MIKRMNNIMRVGIAGSHRVGKSTLAAMIAKEMDLPYLPVSVSTAPVWKESRLSVADTLSFAERVKVQEGILAHGVDCIHAPGVYDRTFLDFIGYLYSNIDSTCSDLFKNQVNQFVENCLKYQSSRFNKTIIVQPGINVVPTEEKIGKTFLSSPYMQAMNNHIIATAINYLNSDDVLIIPPWVVDRDDRLKMAMNFINS